MDELLSRRPPYSLEAEQAVIGSMLIDESCVPEMLELLKPQDFYLQQNQDIFSAMFTMFTLSHRIDPVTVMDHMKQYGVYEEDQTRDYLLQILEITPTAANAKEYAQIVADKSLLRKIDQAASDISQSVSEEVGSAQSILESAEQKIYAIRSGRSSQDLEHIGTILLSVYDLLAERARANSDIPGMSTGLRDLDAKINGLNKSDLVLIAGRPGMGKSSIGLNIAMAVAKNTGKAVVIFNLEMSKVQLAMRLMSNASGIDSQVLQTGKLSEEEWLKLGEASGELSKLDIRIDDNPSITVTEMSAKCRRIENLGIVVVDYLQLMTSATGKVSENRVTAVGEISRALKIMAKELNVPVICLSQLSRANESRADKRPMLSDLRESGSIEQDADEVLFLYREDYYNPDTEEKNIAECIVAKNRHGETGTVKLLWMPQQTTFSDMEWKHREE